MASNAQGGLGKGLGALLKDTATANRVQEIPLSEIVANRYQPRQDFDETALEELKESVESFGVLQPIMVRRLPQGGYELITGERRLRAARLAKLQTIPALIREYNDADMSVIALIENLQREDLNVVEEAKAYERLVKEFYLTQDVIAKRVGRSRSHIANLLRLLNLPPKIQDYVSNGNLSMGQARPLLALSNDELKLEAADFIQAEDLSARQCELLVRKLQVNADYLKNREPKVTVAPVKEPALFLRETEDRLKMFFGSPVRIHQGKKKNKIEIEFRNEEDLNRIIDSLLEKQQSQREAKGKKLASLSQHFTV